MMLTVFSSLMALSTKVDCNAKITDSLERNEGNLSRSCFELIRKVVPNPDCPCFRGL
jgi:hypothetical protein